MSIGPFKKDEGLPLRDPITGYEISDLWVQRALSSLSNDEWEPESREIEVARGKLIEKVKSGLWILLSNGDVLRRGLTTGTTASAACKGAVVSLYKTISRIGVMTPAGIRVFLDVKADSGHSCAVKDPGDHALDITGGLSICARAEASRDTKLIAGIGIGRISRKGLCDLPGKEAISRSARLQIMDAISEGLNEVGLPGAVVEITVPGGEAISSRTLNPAVGVHGGISILGSTGFVEPWNEHLESFAASEIETFDRVVATTGRAGLRFSRILFPYHAVILIGNHLDRLAFRPDQDSILCGLPGLILKWGWPGLLDGSGYATVAEMVEVEPENRRIERALQMVSCKLPFTRIVLLHKDGRIFKDIICKNAASKGQEPMHKA